MHSLAPGEARRLTCARRALAPLLCATLAAGCVPVDRHALAAAANRQYGTLAFTWLVDHDPSALVAWHIPSEQLRQLAPDAHITDAAGERPCPQAAREHAALFLVTGPSARAAREYALDCGFSLYRDTGAVVVTPRP